MNTASPLRYPGGKGAMASLLREVRRLNGLGGLAIAEPFAGGAGASLGLLYNEETPEIYINDADPAVHDLWWALVKRPQAFGRLLAARRVSLAEWRRQRSIYRMHGTVGRLRRGFSAFYLNRCNRSGIIVNGGPIGGIHQKGTWKLDARFNKHDLGRRCDRIAEYRDRIHVSCEDGIEFVKRLCARSVMFFLDPPYFVKGHTLYLNTLDDAYHSALADQLKSMSEAAWVLTYDDCESIRQLYGGWARVRPYSLRYVASERRHGKEVLITPQWLRLPTWQTSAAVRW